MPRGRPRTRSAPPPLDESEEEESEEEEDDSINITFQQQCAPMLAKQWGADQWFEMCKETGKSQECSICLESCLECEKCLALLVPCMHVVHYRCLFSMQRPECPICRPSNTS